MHAYPSPAPSADYAANPYVQPPVMAAVVPYRTSPILAFLLGWIPGVGAIYNGQYLKGLVHAVIFGLLVTAISKSGGGAEPLIGMIVAAFSFYMPFEAFHTAKKRQMGLPVDELSSIVSLNSYANRFPVGPLILIVIGLVFLLDSLHILEFGMIFRFWPLLLIAIGGYMLMGRMATAQQPPPPVYPASPYPPDYAAAYPANYPANNSAPNYSAANYQTGNYPTAPPPVPGSNVVEVRREQ